MQIQERERVAMIKSARVSRGIFDVTQMFDQPNGIPPSMVSLIDPLMDKETFISKYLLGFEYDEDLEDWVFIIDKNGCVAPDRYSRVDGASWNGPRIKVI